MSRESGTEIWCDAACAMSVRVHLILSAAKTMECSGTNCPMVEGIIWRLQRHHVLLPRGALLNVFLRSHGMKEMMD